MAKNLCFEKNPDVIGDILFEGAQNIDVQNLIPAVVGLCRIVASQQAQINVLAKDLLRIAEEHRREIVTNTGKIELIADKSIAQGEALRIISQLFNNIKKEGE